MTVNGVIVSNEKNMIGEGLKVISNVKRASGLSKVKKYGSGLRILK